MDAKFSYNAPSWAEFVFQSGDEIYWGCSEGYLNTRSGPSQSIQSKWNQGSYEHWKGDPSAVPVSNQLEND